MKSETSRAQKNNDVSSKKAAYIRLLLGSGISSGGSLSLGVSLASTGHLLLNSGGAESVESSLGLGLSLGDLGELGLERWLLWWQDDSLGLNGSLALLLGGLSLLGVVASAWEDDELSLVCLQSRDVVSQGLLGCVGSAEVYRDSDSQSLLAVDSGGLELLKGESASQSGSAVVLDGGTVDDWSQKSLGWAWEDTGSLLGTILTTSVLLGGLVEPGLNETFPVLVEMSIGDLVVVLHLSRVSYIYTKLR
jgi:hypothetical protein